MKTHNSHTQSTVRTPNRRDFLKIGAAGMSVGLLRTIGPGGQSSPTAASAATATGPVRVVGFLNPTNKPLKEQVIPQIEKKLGLDIEFTMIPYAAGYLEKLMMAMASGTAPYDVYMWWDQLFPTTWKNLAPLDDYIKQYNYAEVLAKDFSQPWLRFTTNPGDGKRYGLPAIADLWVYFYRDDMLKKAGVRVPTIGRPWTNEEWGTALEKLTKPNEKEYGYALLGKRDPLQVFSLAHVYYSVGAEMFKSNWYPNYDDPKTVEALTKIQKLRGFAPPGAENFIHDGVMTAFGTGRAATGSFATGWIMGTQPIMDPGLASQVNWLGRDPGTNSANHVIFTWCWTIDRNSQRKDAAFRVIMEMLAPENNETVALAGGSHHLFVRKSTYKNPKVIAKYPFLTRAEELITDKIRPIFFPTQQEMPKGWHEIMDAIALAHSRVITGESPKKVADETQQDLLKLMNKWQNLRK